jgi:glycosyltransferase involved in cell wall biosynthesis
MMAEPLVFVGIPTYNRAASLRRSVELIQAQDYRNLRILISDNASDDDTREVAEKLAAGDPRIRYVRHERSIGLYGNHNFCIDQADGEFLCLFHDHDEHAPEMIGEYVRFMERHPEVGIVCSDWDLIDENGALVGVRELDVPEVTRGLDYIERTIRSGRSSIGIPGAMTRRAALGNTRFDETAPIGFGDFVVWFAIAEQYDIGHVRRRLWRWKQQRNSQSARTIESLIRDYDANVIGYCEAHLTRWPGHDAIVRRWKAAAGNFVFWALAYELALHCRRRLGFPPRADARTLFDINDYDLGAADVARVRQELGRHRRGFAQLVAWLGIEASFRLHAPWLLAWSTYHHASLRRILGLR